LIVVVHKRKERRDGWPVDDLDDAYRDMYVFRN
jgi:hypothetical protein